MTFADECEESPWPCSAYESCANTQGGFTCEKGVREVRWGSSSQHKLKLENGHYGNILVKVSGQPWRGVCDDYFTVNMNGANVVCKMLGYPSAKSRTGGSGYGNYDGSDTFALDDIQCSGYESSLQYCTYSTTDNCKNHEYAGVECNRH